MERQVRRAVRLSAGILVGLGFVLLPAARPALADPTPSSGPGEAISVSLPAGVSLAPGSYDVVIRGDGREIRAKVIVVGPSSQQAGEGTPTPGPVQVEPATVHPATEDGEAGSTVSVIVLGSVLAVVVGLLGYTKILVPRRRMRSYRQALDLLAAGQWARAVPELSRLESALPTRRRADARFFIAFALYRLDNLDEAEHRLAALHREDPGHVDVAYLLAYILVARRSFDRAEQVLEMIEAAGKLDAGRIRRLFGVVTFHRALEAFRDGRVDAAAQLFEKVDRLGDFRERIPTDLRNRHAVLGAQALFEKDLHRARGQFESLEQAAQRLDPEHRDPMLASAKLGLALAAWIEDTPGSPRRVEDLLVEAARLVDPAGALTRPWADGDAADIAERLAALADGEGRSPEQHDRDRTLRDIHFLRGLAVLREWARVDRATAAGSVGTYLDAALARLACARDRDPDFSDVYLVVGLLRYYLAATDRDRAAGVGLLREAQKLGTRDPEVFQIVNHHDRLRQAHRDAVDAYLEVLDRYLLDGTVREQVRAALVQRLSRYAKVRGWDSRPELTRVRTVQPTVAEINDRSQLLRERVSQLVAMQPGADDLAAARELSRSLEHESRVLSEHARAVEQKEAELLALVGDRLLVDNGR